MSDQRRNSKTIQIGPHRFETYNPVLWDGTVSDFGCVEPQLGDIVIIVNFTSHHQLSVWAKGYAWRHIYPTREHPRPSAVQFVPDPRVKTHQQILASTATQGVELLTLDPSAIRDTPPGAEPWRTR